MAHSKHTVTVPHPIAEVYAILADGLNKPKWRPDVTDVHLESGSAASLGSAYAQTMKGPGGRAIRGDYRTTATDDGRDDRQAGGVGGRRHRSSA